VASQKDRQPSQEHIYLQTLLHTHARTHALPHFSILIQCFVEYSRTVAASSEASSSTPKLITDGSQEATSCLDVVFECQPFCLTTLQDLLAQCGEVLATPLGSAPPCTEGCRGILQTSLNTGFGVKLLNCDCASVQDVPQIGPLCRPYQQNALKKCNLSIDG
jgi:hypothetical protein